MVTSDPETHARIALSQDLANFFFYASVATSMCFSLPFLCPVMRMGIFNVYVPPG